jgi:hypothetical protein
VIELRAQGDAGGLSEEDFVIGGIIKLYLKEWLLR